MKHKDSLTILVFGLLIVFNTEFYGQNSSYIALPYTSTELTQTIFVTPTQSGNMLMVYRSTDRLLVRRSTDQGRTWAASNSPDTSYFYSITNNFISGVYLPSGKIAVLYKKSSTDINIVSSDDNGMSWSVPVKLSLPGTIFQRVIIFGNLFPLTGNSLVFTFVHQGNIYYKKSGDGGATWDSTIQVTTVQNPNIKFVHGTMVSPTHWIISGSGTNGSSDESFLYHSTNGGINWGSIQLFPSLGISTRRPIVIADSSQKLTIFYEVDSSLNGGMKNTDIVYATSTNMGTTWTEPIWLTKYVGDDRNVTVAQKNSSIYITFLSFRSPTGEYKYTYTAYTGIAKVSEDNLLYPLIYNPEIRYDEQSALLFRQKIYTSYPLVSAVMNYNIDDSVFIPVKLYDDATHGDSLAGDNIFTGVLNGLLTPFKEMKYGFYYYTVVSDTKQNSAVTEKNLFVLGRDTWKTAELISSNAFKLPINTKGDMGDVYVDVTTPGGKYLNKVVLFSEGFVLSGLNNSGLWANAVWSAIRLGDYLPGTIDKSINCVFSVKSSDAPFSDSWKRWQIAVMAGASFYDGDGDGKYLPDDKNKNGRWDPNEDRPDLIGDFTYYTVFNDAVPAANRRYTDVKPQGIEIRQTIFGWGSPIRKELNNSIFARYEIINRNSLIPYHDSVYFSLATDADLGDYQDDLIGCDSLLNTGYVYNPGPDAAFGSAPPALFLKYIYGPQYAKQGETYLDNNGNGKYDEGIDTALKTASLMHGPVLGKKQQKGYGQRMMSSFSHPLMVSMHSTALETKGSARLHQVGGLNNIGERINPCTWIWGNGSTLSNCNLLNPAYLYSGDPEAGTNWLNTNPQDQRMLVNSGPFRLEYNKPVELLMCFTIGDGNSATNSVTVGKRYLRYIDSLAAGNFSGAPGENVENEPVVEYASNYPNPFNPSTTISFTLGSRGDVTVKIYDVLGREIKTLVNEIRERGLHRVQFNGAGLSSGVYFYEIKTPQKRIINKMILVK